MSNNPQSQASNMRSLVVKEEHIQALLMRLPSSEECLLPPHQQVPSCLAPETTIPQWPHHLATYHATILEFLTQHSNRMNLNQLESLNICCTHKNTTIATYLHLGWNLFSKENQIRLFGSTEPSLQQYGSCFDSVLPLVGKTWSLIGKNDIAAPWRDYMVRTGFLERGSFEIRFYLFHMAVAEYFRIVAIARQRLFSGQSHHISFSEQEYSAWCRLLAATFLLFRFRRIPQVQSLVGVVMRICDKAETVRFDVTKRINRLMQIEQNMKWELSHMSLGGIADHYSMAYSSQAVKMQQAYQAFGIPML